MHLFYYVFMYYHVYIYARVSTLTYDEPLVLDTNEKIDVKKQECLLSVIKRKRNDMAKKIEMNQEMLPPGTNKTFIFEQHNMKNIELKTLQHLKKPLKILHVVGNMCFFNTTVQYLFSQQILFSFLVENYMYNDFSVLFLNFYLKSVAIENEIEKLQKTNGKYERANIWALKTKNGCIIDGFFTLCAELYDRWKGTKSETYFRTSNSINTITCVLHLLLNGFYDVKSIDNEVVQMDRYNIEGATTPLVPYLNIYIKNNNIEGIYGMRMYFTKPDLENNIQNILNGDNSSNLQAKHHVINYEKIASLKPHWLQIEVNKLHYGSGKDKSICVNIPEYLDINGDKYMLTAFCCTNYTSDKNKAPCKVFHAWSFCKYLETFYNCNDGKINEVDGEEALKTASFSSDLLLYTKITILAKARMSNRNYGS